MRQKRALYLLFSLLLLSLFLLSAGLGAVSISPLQILAMLFKKLSIFLSIETLPTQEAVFFHIRLPRILLGALIGASLATSGAAMQGVFRNPLADPGLLGVSSGASLAAIFFLVIGASLFEGFAQTLGYIALPLLAFIGGLLTSLLVLKLSQREGHTITSALLLSGIAINALAGSIIGLLTVIANDAQLRSITFWGLGSLGGAAWGPLLSASPFLLISIFGIPRFARELNLFLLGEAEAKHLGVQVERCKRRLILLSALGVGASVAVAGIIGFVGLVVPHLIRLLLGPDHRFLLGLSALLGASLVLLADLLARTIAAPAEIPLGVLTSALGTPFFLGLLRRSQEVR